MISIRFLAAFERQQTKNFLIVLFKIFQIKEIARTYYLRLYPSRHPGRDAGIQGQGW